MADFNLSVVDNVITLDSRPDVVTSGSVNIYKAAFVFDESWDGYALRACFACGTDRREAVIVDGQCKVPWEVLRPNGYLHIGVYGTNGERRRPTTWTRESVYITPGAEPGDETITPSPTVYDELYSKIAEVAASLTDHDNDETAHHAATDADVLLVLAEESIIDPVVSPAGAVLTDNAGKVYVL